MRTINNNEHFGWELKNEKLKITYNINELNRTFDQTTYLTIFESNDEGTALKIKEINDDGVFF